MTFAVSSWAEAKSLMDYFNAFHDGFIRHLILNSQDSFEQRGTQQYGPGLHLTIRFAHYNYRNGAPPPTQQVEATFYDVKQLALDFTGHAYDWAIQTMGFEEAMRHRDDGVSEPCLRAVLRQSRLSSTQTWVIHDDLTFTFLNAAFTEIP